MVAVYAALWPVVLSTAAGVAAVHPRQYDVARVLHLSRAATVRKIVVPAVVPTWLAGARMAAIAALLVAIVAEMIIWPRGLGGGLTESLHALAPARMWVYALTCGVVGYLLNLVLRQVVRLAADGGQSADAVRQPAPALRGLWRWRVRCWCGSSLWELQATRDRFHRPPSGSLPSRTCTPTVCCCRRSATP